jgi:hypothetical protein
MKDLLNEDINPVHNVANIQNCADPCTLTNGCQSISFTQSTCYLKRPAQNYVLKSTVSSMVLIPQGFSCFAHSDFFQSDIWNQSLSYDDCIAACNAYATCNAFTWVLHENSSLGQCFLKNLQGNYNPIPNDRGAVACKNLTALWPNF